MPEIEFDPVDSIAAGAVGEPGARAFYIQAEKDGQINMSFQFYAQLFNLDAANRSVGCVANRQATAESSEQLLHGIRRRVCSRNGCRSGVLGDRLRGQSTRRERHRQSRAKAQGDSEPVIFGLGTRTSREAGTAMDKVAADVSRR